MAHGNFGMTRTADEGVDTMSTMQYSISPKASIDARTCNGHLSGTRRVWEHPGYVCRHVPSDAPR